MKREVQSLKSELNALRDTSLTVTPSMATGVKSA